MEAFTFAVHSRGVAMAVVPNLSGEQGCSHLAA